VSAAGSFLDAGVAYVRFAEENRGHFEVMFRPGLYHADDPDLVAARKRSSDALYAGAPARVTGLAGWSIAHGFATLRLSGALPELGDPDEATRAVLRELGP
jgi:hypothetical protein